MADKKDELITGAELAKRLNVDASYITKMKKQKKLTGCIYNKKYYYRKSCYALGRDPDDQYTSRQSELQKEVKASKKEQKKEQKKVTEKKELKKELEQEPKKERNTKQKKNKEQEQEPEGHNEDEAKTLLEQILKAIKDPASSANRTKLDILRQKAGVLREYFTAKNEEIKNRKLEENLFDRDEVMKILGFAMNMIRNSLIDLPNNYAVNLEGLSQKEIKEFVTDDTNKILEDLLQVGNQFE